MDPKYVHTSVIFLKVKSYAWNIYIIKKSKFLIIQIYMFDHKIKIVGNSV